MKRIWTLLVLMLAVLLASGGCGHQSLDYTRSNRNPVVVYSQSQALPPQSAPHGPVLIIYGDGTAYQRHEQMDYVTGTVPQDEIQGLLASIIDEGFFEMAGLQGKDKPGGITDHVTVTIKNKSKGVEGPDGSGGDFGAVLDTVKQFKIPDAKEYLPDNIGLYAVPYTNPEPFNGTVLDWTADPALLEQAAAPVAGVVTGNHVSGAQAQQVWKLLKGASGLDEEVAWRAGGKLYVQVYAVPQFPLPGI